MEKIEDGGPAFPAQFFDERATGMTLRQYAAIKLKVPESGTDWLDAMIEKSLRDDFAAKAMGPLMAEIDGNDGDNPGSPMWESHTVAELAYEQAGDMLKARKGGAE